MTIEETIQSVKGEFKGEFCYTALKVAMNKFAQQQAIEFLKWVIKNDGIDHQLAYEIGYSESKMVEEFPHLYNIFLKSQQITQ